MTSNTTTACTGEAEDLLFDSWFDPIKDGLRAKVRGFIEALIEEELTTALSRPRYGRRAGLPHARSPRSGDGFCRCLQPVNLCHQGRRGSRATLGAVALRYGRVGEELSQLSRHLRE